MRPSIAFAWCACAGLLAGCFNDPHFAYPHLLVPGNTPAEKTAYEQAEAQKFDPYPDPNLNPNITTSQNNTNGLRPLGYEQPREPYPVRPAAAPVIVVPEPATTAAAPYPAAAPSFTAPGSFPAASPAPYPGAVPGPTVSPNYAPTPGPAPAPYQLR